MGGERRAGVLFRSLNCLSRAPSCREKNNFKGGSQLPLFFVGLAVGLARSRAAPRFAMQSLRPSHLLRLSGTGPGEDLRAAR